MSNFSSNLLSISMLLKNEYDDVDKGKTYSIPHYQRRYVWNDENVEKLVEDLVESLNDDKEYFIGGIVLSRETIENNKTDCLEVIDGQQRLTTLAILTATIVYVLELNENNYKNDLLEYRKQKAKELSELIIFKKTTKDRKVIEKVKIERMDSLNELFVQILKILINFEWKNEKDKLNKFTNIQEEYKNKLISITKKLIDKVKQIDSTDSDHLINFIDHLFDKTKIVVTKTNDIDTGFLVFEKLNDSGIALEPEDLLKNYIFKNSNETEYKQISEKWEIFLNIVSEINIKSKIKPREFLENYIVINGIDIKNKSIFYNLKKLKTENFNLSMELLDDLITIATKYKELRNNSFISKYLNAMNFKLGYIIILATYKVLGEQIYEKNIKEILAIVVRFGLTFILTGNPRGISQEVPKLSKLLTEDKLLDENKILDRFKNKINELIHNKKQEFYQSIVNNDFYNKHKKITKFLFSILNYHLDGTKIGINTLTIEHLMSQNPNKNCTYSSINNDNIQLYTNKIGNLTVIHQSGNSSCGNKCFHEKVKCLLENQNIYITRSIKENQNNKTRKTKFNNFQSKYDFKPLNDNSVWGKEYIENRSESLAKLAEYVVIEKNMLINYFE